MKITIRKALAEDAYDYTDCFISCMQTSYRGIVTDEYLNNLSADREKSVVKFRKNLTIPGLETYCVLSEKEMIGFLVIYKKDGDIWAIYLLEEFRRKGYGKEMLDFAIAELKHIGHKKVSLWVFEENSRARRFYEKNGLHFDGAKRETDKYGKMLVQLRYTMNLH